MAQHFANKFLTLQSIDKLLAQHEKNPDLYVLLYQKKVKFLQNISNGKLDAKKYSLICKKLLNEEPNQDIKTFIDMELTLLMDGQEEQWFADIMAESKEEFETQQKLYQKFNQKEQPIGQSKMKKKSSIPMQETTTNISKSVKGSQSLEISKVFSLKLLDTLMETATDQMFLKLFAQKEKLIGLMQQGKLVDKVYYAGIGKMLKEGSSFGLSEDEIFTVQMELDLLNDLHDGNVGQWFKDVVDSTGEFYEDQQAKVESIKNGGKKMKKKSSSIKEDVIIDQEIVKESLAKSQNVTQIMTTTVNKPNKFLCFRYLQQQLEASREDPDKFCKLFEKKLQVINMMKSGKITASSYREGLNVLIKETDNEQQKEAAEMQITMNDIDGNADEFFKSSVQQFGENFEQQQQRYNKLSNQKPQQKSKAKSKDNTISSLYQVSEAQKRKQRQMPKPVISDIVSFRVIVDFLDTFKKDYDYCLQLKAKGKKLYSLVEDKKLGPNQYKQFLIKKCSETDDKRILTIMQRELKEYENASNIGKLFKKSVNEYLDKVKINLGKRRSFDDDFIIDEAMINTLSKQIQIEFLIRKLGKYESLMTYFRNNKLDAQYQSFNQEYAIIKDQALQICESIKNQILMTSNEEKQAEGQEQNKHIDLKEYVQRNLPNITFGMFHRMTKSQYEQKIDEIIEHLKGSAKQYMEYTKKIKKGSNKNNFETANKVKESIVSDIDYLQSLKNKDFVPLPKVEITKQPMYNMDLNKNLSENQIQIILTNVVGVPGNQCILKVYMVNMKEYRFKANIKEGLNQNVNTIIALPPSIMQQIIKGTDKKRYLMFKFVSKGWFGQSTIDQVSIDLNFIRSNVMEETVSTEKDELKVSFIAKVLKPKKPIVTDVKSVILQKYPEYQHSKLVQNQFLKSLIPFENPTQSEIVR